MGIKAKEDLSAIYFLIAFLHYTMSICFKQKRTNICTLTKLQGQELFVQHLVNIHQIKNYYLSEESAASIFILLT